MNRDRKYQNKKLNNIKLKLVIFIFLCLFTICSISIFLNYHLFAIQKIERLDKIRDYSEYKIKIDKGNYSGERLIFENENERFYLSCLNDVYVYYGKTYSTLDYILKKGYLNSKMLLNNLYEENFNGYSKFSNQATNVKDEQYAIYRFVRDNDKIDYFITSL